MVEPHSLARTALDVSLGDLIKKAKEGDLQAFQGLYDHYAKRLLNFSYKLLGNREEAEDVLQETFTAVFRKLKSLKDLDRFEAWIFRIARNFIYLRYRTRTGEHISLESGEELENESQGLEARGKSPEEAALADELKDVVGRVVRALPDKYREVFILSAIVGLSYQTIAEITDKSIPSVKTDIHRARLEVRDKIKHYLRIDTDEPMH
jgi:RNA polymerase sigma-70 factor (ECF subfamily)